MIRGQDAFGSGAYGASRDGGSRKHEGVDIVAKVGEPFVTQLAGKVDKLGYMYADDLSWRYVQLDLAGIKFRFAYIKPTVFVGEVVEAGDVLGIVQDLPKRYPGITPHVHFEVHDRKGRKVDPTSLVKLYFCKPYEI